MVGKRTARRPSPARKVKINGHNVFLNRPADEKEVSAIEVTGPQRSIFQNLNKISYNNFTKP